MSAPSTSQADAVNATLRAAGVQLPQSAEPPTRGGAATDDLPPIELPRKGRYNSEFFAEVGAVCARNGVYRRDRSVVTVNHGNGMAVPLDPKRFSSYLEKVAYPCRRVRKQDEEERLVKESIGETLSGLCLASDQFLDKTRPLTAVHPTRAPIMRPDGSIQLLSEGYDAESGVLTLRAPGVEIDETMSIEAARTLYLDYLDEFDFVDWDGSDRKSGRSYAIMGAQSLAVFAAGLFPAAAKMVGFLHNAARHGSGKTLLAEFGLVPFFGEVTTASKLQDEVHFTSVLDTAALSGVPYLFLDDLEGKLKSQALNRFMTSEHWSGRLFHTQRQFAVGKKITVIMSGHSLTFSGDLSRRFLVTKLHVPTFDQDDRKFKRVLTSHFLKRPAVRSGILSALWAFIRHWDKEGRPKPKRKISGFDDWTDIICGITECVGLGDALVKQEDEDSIDSEGSDMKRMVALLARDMAAQGRANKTWLFKELVVLCANEELFRDAIDGKFKEDTDGEQILEVELKRWSQGKLSQLWGDKYGGQEFVVDGVTVRFGTRGAKRARGKYVVEMLP